MHDPITIEPKPNGPLHVRGALTLTKSSGESITTEAQFWLCRCGGSANKPFCDGTHGRQGFQSVCEARDLPPPAPKA